MIKNPAQFLNRKSGAVFKGGTYEYICMSKRYQPTRCILYGMNRAASRQRRIRFDTHTTNPGARCRFILSRPALGSVVYH